MTSRTIVVTRTDLQRLTNLLQSHSVQAVGNDRAHLAELKDELDQATVVESADMLPEIITMNSTFKLLDLDRKEADTFTLVYPDDACIAEGKLSILSPLGAEVFARQVGDEITLRVLQRETRKRVEGISFQPERVGAFNL
ncbi:MAG: GreA/GreB family elongation factor [Novipirellula sp. JB048]